MFEPDLCRRLIDVYDAQGGEASGFMREIGGKTRPVMDGRHKRRQDAFIEDCRLAVSINLSAAFEGGDPRILEFGSRTYRPPPAGTVVLSCSRLHETTPVTKGRRYAFLPFL